jgi:hypothetical protein
MGATDRSIFVGWASGQAAAVKIEFAQ